MREALKKRVVSRTRSTGQEPGYAQVGIQLPRFYARVLDGEAAFLGQRRAQILELLVLRKAGLLLAERAPSAPSYNLEREELHATERYIWHCRRGIKAHLDRMRLRMGNVPPRTWIILALNEWIGLPAGVTDVREHGTMACSSADDR